MCEKFAHKLVKALENIVYILMLALVAILFSQVCLRYFFGKGFVWAEELSRTTFVWIIFIAIAIQVYYGRYLAITFLYDKAVKRSKIPYFVVQGIILVFFVFLAYHGTRYTVNHYAKISQALSVRMCWLYMIMPISSVISLFFVANDMVKTLTSAKETGQ